MPRNQARYHRGRSAVARRVMMTAGSTNGMMPQIECEVCNRMGVPTGEKISPCRYFGGDKKGGAAPSATGFMIPSGRRHMIAAKASRPCYLFKMKTQPGPAPFGFGPHA